MRLPANEAMGAQPRLCIALRYPRRAARLPLHRRPRRVAHGRADRPGGGGRGRGGRRALPRTAPARARARPRALAAHPPVRRRRRRRRGGRPRAGRRGASSTPAASACSSSAPTRDHSSASPSISPIGAALDRLRRAVVGRGGLELRKGDHGVFLVALDDSATISPRALAERLVEIADEETGAEGPGGDRPVGVGGPHDLTDARRSYREACDAVTVAERIERFGRIATWDELGAYRTLLALPGRRRRRRAAPRACSSSSTTRPTRRSSERSRPTSTSRATRRRPRRPSDPAPGDALLPPQPPSRRSPARG